MAQTTDTSGPACLLPFFQAADSWYDSHQKNHPKRGYVQKGGGGGVGITAYRLAGLRPHKAGP